MNERLQCGVLDQAWWERSRRGHLSLRITLHRQGHGRGQRPKRLFVEFHGEHRFSYEHTHRPKFTSSRPKLVTWAAHNLCNIAFLESNHGAFVSAARRDCRTTRTALIADFLVLPASISLEAAKAGR